LVVSIIFSSCAYRSEDMVSGADKGLSPSVSYRLPTPSGSWMPDFLHESRKPAGTASVSIEKVGVFKFNAQEIQTVRPDIFQAGHFSLFDIIVYLDKRGDISLKYYFDDSADTHVITSINGQEDWWYTAYYSGGWDESIVFRMDMFPYKDGAEIRYFHYPRVDAIYDSFREEVARFRANGRSVTLPEVTIIGPRLNLNFTDVKVTAHNLRSDVFRPGIVTAMDVLLSLAEQGKIDRLKLTWYDYIGKANPVENYFTEQINTAEASGTCGFVYEAGPRLFHGFSGNHIHLASDVRIIISPEYALWFWICL